MTNAISSTFVRTSRLGMQVLTSGPRDATTTVVFIHGNCSSSRFYELTMESLPEHIRAIAPDLRGFGRTDRAPIDATRGMRDFSDDLAELLRSPELGINGPVQLVGWSAGAGVVMQFAIDYPSMVDKIVLESPASPYGFGGTKRDGSPCNPDFAGSGGGTANPDFVKRLAAGDASGEADTSPRKVMNTFYFKAPFRAEEKLEDMFVAEMLAMAVGDDYYPGDLTQSTHWPCIAPGKRGMNNALSPAYYNMSGFADIDTGHEVLWIRGDSDQIVSDNSLFDLGVLGKLGVVPGWPGDDAYPCQPMVSQMRDVLERYGARGGKYREVVFKDCGHSPHIELPQAFRDELVQFLGAR